MVWRIRAFSCCLKCSNSVLASTSCIWWVIFCCPSSSKLSAKTVNKNRLWFGWRYGVAYFLINTHISDQKCANVKENFSKSKKKKSSSTDFMRTNMQLSESSRQRLIPWAAWFCASVKLSALWRRLFSPLTWASSWLMEEFCAKICRQKRIRFYFILKKTSP